MRCPPEPRDLREAATRIVAQFDPVAVRVHDAFQRQRVAACPFPKDLLCEGRGEHHPHVGVVLERQPFRVPHLHSHRDRREHDLPP